MYLDAIDGMRDLDETDLEILSLLVEDGRRPFSAIGDEVGLSGPAVADRVNRLRESEVINGFTVDVNRTRLRAGVPVFVRLEDVSDSADELKEAVAETDGVEHVFVTSEGEVWFYGRAEGNNIRGWIEGILGDTADARYSVTIIDDVEWAPSIEGTDFALACAECGNTVDSEGETTRIDGDVYHFCCPSCQSRFEERYQELEEGV